MSTYSDSSNITDTQSETQTPIEAAWHSIHADDFIMMPASNNQNFAPPKSAMRFANSLWKTETITEHHFIIWTCLNAPCLIISLMSQYFLYFLYYEWSIPGLMITIFIYAEKILSILYITIYSCAVINLLLKFCTYRFWHIFAFVIIIIIINVLYIGYRCVLLIYYPFFTEFITFWLVLQTINYLALKSVIFLFVNSTANSSQSGCYQLKQTVSVISGYLDNIAASYVPQQSAINNKTKILIEFLCFHLAMIVLLLRIKICVLTVTEIDEYYRERCKQDIDNAINELMECINVKLIDYNNKNHINCPHFNDKFDLKMLMVSTDKFAMSGNIILTLFYVVMNCLFWNTFSSFFWKWLNIFILLIGCFVYGLFYLHKLLFNDKYHGEPENWDKLCKLKGIGRCYALRTRKNKMHITYDLLMRIYASVQYSPKIYSFFIRSLMKPKYIFKDQHNKIYLSRYQQIILLNFELFLPIYFSWHIISTAFNDNFTISRIVINYLYGITQFILKTPFDSIDAASGFIFFSRLEMLNSNQIAPFSRTYDQICNEYEINVT